MPKLILIKHASPQQEIGVPSHEWKLSADGRERAAAFVDRLRRHDPDIVVTSDEPKAIETGEIVANGLGIGTETAPDLHEHDRSDVPMMRTGEFISAMAQFFRDRDRLVLGSETAAAVEKRFAHAITAVLTRHSGRNVAVVSHGTVLALFGAPIVEGDPFSLWRRMKLPSFIVVDQETKALIELVEQA